MNVDTGLLLRIAEQGRNIGMTIVPKELAKEAEKELEDKEEVVVDMTKDTPLVRWAKSQQHKPSAKNRRSMQKKSKRINRRK